MKGNIITDNCMKPVIEALDKHLPKGDAWTEIYNRCYEAIDHAINQHDEIKALIRKVMEETK